MRALVSLAVFLTATGLCLETNLLAPAEIQKRISMREICNFEKLPISVRTRDFLLISSASEPLYSLQGKDRRGKRWLVILNDAARGAWSSDASGYRTYYFAGYTGAAGSGPATWILALSFDEIGRPVPFFVTTHGSYDATGIADLLDLDGSGPELLEQSYWGNMMNDPGYYVTTLYRQRGPFWYRSDGRHGAHFFPAFEKWSAMWKNRPAELVAGAPFQQPVRDSSNNPAAGIRTRVLGANKYVIHVDPEIGCQVVRPAVSVTDSAAGRKVDLQPNPEELAALAAARSTAILTGLYRWPGGRECDASILWISTGH